MTKKFIGSIFLLLGTCIGAGMLALPIVSVHETFAFSVMLLITAWLCMTIGAFAILTVNMWFAPGSNLLTMAQGTLGRWGKLITAIVYLLLMYSLLCAYLAAASGIVHLITAAVFHQDISRGFATFITLLILSAIVYRGMGAVDFMNRVFMSIKLVIFLVIVVMLLPNVQINQLVVGDLMMRNDTFIVMVTSFGYATILPSLREYLQSDRASLNKVVVIGSLIPLVIFFVWLLVVKGVLPREGDDGLIAMSISDNPSGLMMLSIARMLTHPWMKFIASIFVSVYVLTSFLCVSMGLSDFVADAIKRKKEGKHKILVHVLCFLPPLLLVLFQPGIFITALSYAGQLCIILLMLLPLLMFYTGRYHQQLGSCRRITGERWVVLLLIVMAVGFLLVQFF